MPHWGFLQVNSKPNRNISKRTGQTSNKCRTYIHGPQMMNPSGFDDPTDFFPLYSATARLTILVMSELSQRLLKGLAGHVEQTFTSGWIVGWRLCFMIKYLQNKWHSHQPQPVADTPDLQGAGMKKQKGTSCMWWGNSMQKIQIHSKP